MRIILFDGICNFCDASVQFIMKRDNGAFKFASLQSDIGQELVTRHKLQGIDSLVLIEEDKAYTKSTAALRIAKRLKGLWSVLYIGIIIPKPLRDPLYDLFAKNRYRLFGKKDACMLPTKEERARFLS
ncbi:thiol-disulfide oxidoreductase DCC family protein [Lysinibacillus sp. 3P01SB]|uniref:thiol-disulfide oxidoreductase DCC family protein n=1 Tax=Lysinibacillus sp. 3P01SB TaxID=3132284 RepID=UPI0039A5A9ED